MLREAQLMQWGRDPSIGQHYTWFFIGWGVLAALLHKKGAEEKSTSGRAEVADRKSVRATINIPQYIILVQVCLIKTNL